MAGRKRIYEDDLLKSKCFRISFKYELKYVKAFIDIIREYRKETIEFIEKYKPKL